MLSNTFYVNKSNTYETCHDCHPRMIIFGNEKEQLKSVEKTNDSL